MVQTQRLSGLMLAALSILFYSLPFSAFAANSILNPSFETGTGNVATNWSASIFHAVPSDNNAVLDIVADAHTGTRAARVTITQYTSGDGKWVPDAFTVSPGQYYTISFWYKSSTTTSTFLIYNNSTFQWIKDLPASANWTQYTGSILVPAGVTQLQVMAELARVGTISTDDYSVELQTSAPVFPQGMVTLSFDDGWQTFQDVAKPILDASSFKATAYIITGPEGSNIGGTPNGGYMTTATLMSLQQAGFEIGVHTRSHQDLANANWASLGYASQTAFWDSEVAGARTDLTTGGFTPADTLAYPYGQYTDTLKTYVAAHGLKAARSVDQGFNFSNSDKYALKIMPINDQSTAAGINALVDQAVSDKTWLILMFHHVRMGAEATGAGNAACVDGDNPLLRDPDCTTSTMLQGLVSHLATKPAGTVVTMDQGLAAMDAATSRTITVTSTGSGTVTPNGVVTVANGANQSFTFTPASGYMLGTLTVDGAPVAIASPYTFTAVTANHTLDVSFVEDNTPPAVVLATTATNPTNLSQIPVSVTFSKPVSGFDLVDIVVNNGSKSSFLASSTTQYSFNVAPTADGDVVVSIPAGIVFATASSTLGNTASNVLTVTSNRSVPVITLNGDAFVSTPVGAVYTDAGATVTAGGTLTTTSNVSTSTVGTYTVTYTASNAAGNLATPVTRTVVVTELDVTSQQSTTVTTSSFVVTWTSVQPGTSRVVYDTVSHSPLTTTGPNFGYAFSTAEDAATTTTHTVTVTGLNANTKYYFRAVSHGSPEIVGPEMSVTTAGNPAPASSGGGGGGGGGGNGPIIGSFGGSIIGSALSGNASTGAGGGIVLGVSTFKFTKDLSKGMRHADVMELQKRLASEGLLKIDVPTNYFGSMTEAAVKSYQGKHNLPMVGRVGPKTRMVLNGDSASSNGSLVPGISESEKASLIEKLQAQLKVLMEKIATMVAQSNATTSTSTTSTSTASSVVSTASTTQSMQTSTSTSASTSTQQ